MVGFFRCQKRMIVEKSRSRISRQASTPLGRVSICSLRSKPEEKFPPAPVITKRADFFVALNFIEGELQFAKHPLVNGIQQLRPRQGQERNGSAPLQANSLVGVAHAHTRNRSSTAGIGSRPRPGPAAL